MATQKVNKYEATARYSLLLGAFGALCAIALAFAVLTAFKPSDFEVVMAQNGPRHLAILGSVAIAMLTGVIGAYLGFNSVHQRNPRNQLAWAGFFLNSGVMTLALCVFVFFWLTSEIIKR